MLVLGAQVLLGFQFRSFFEKRFNEWPDYAHELLFVGVLMMIGAMLLLILPAAHHRIVEQGEDTVEQHNLTTTVMDFALLPFALALGVDSFLAFDAVFATRSAVVAGISISLLTLFLWYGWQWIERARLKKRPQKPHASGQGRTPLNDKINHVLTECRVVLPGVQALLGFQFATVLMEEFNRLPASSKVVHLAGLLCIGLSMVLLIMPAAYHRIVEEGEETERFHRFASVVLLAALPPLVFAISADLFVITRRLTHSVSISVCAAAATSIIMIGTWFGAMFWLRSVRHRRTMEEAAHAI
jgi:hypothetical protein